MTQELVHHVRQLGDNLFGKRSGLLSLWQEIADNFYPTRADFTHTRNIGAEMASNLMTSAPVLAHRSLGNAFGAMLRPTAKEWFKPRSQRPDKEDTEAKQYLEWIKKIQKNAMYDSKASLARATKEADMDFAAFGQAVLQSVMYRPADGSTPHLHHRCHHLRDTAWMENELDVIDTVFRKWSPTAITLSNLFRKSVHPNVTKLLEKTPYSEVNCWHVVVPKALYETFPGAKKFRQPFVCLYIDCDNQHLLEEVPMWVSGYIIPRWQTVSGSQYAHSPATVAALPDARLLQSITGVLLESGEKAVNPPMVAVQDAVRGDIPVYAGGVTWIDADYDERTGEALRPMSSDHKGLSFGLDLIQDIRHQLQESFFLNKLNLPPSGGPDMTAYEVGQRVQEFIRNTLPLFEPMEMEYNAKLCETDLELLMRADMSIAARAPQSMRGTEIEFSFESPLREAIDKAKVGQFLEAGQVITQAIQLEPAAAFIVDGAKAVRDVLTAVVPADWMRTESESENLRRNAIAAQQQQQALELMQKAGDVAKTASEAAGNTARMTGMSAEMAA